jgi:hypothetical protein
MNKLIQVNNNVSRLLFSKNYQISRQQICGFKVVSEQRNSSAKHSQKQKAVRTLLFIKNFHDFIFSTNRQQTTVL